MLQLRVIALFYLDNSRKIHPRGLRACQPKDVKRREPQRTGEKERERVRKGEKESERGGEREREHARGRERESFGSSFYMFFPPPGPALCKLGLARSAVCST